jgi:hypothetical protein
MEALAVMAEAQRLTLVAQVARVAQAERRK